MKFRTILIILGIFGIMALATAALAAGSVANPEGLLKGERGDIPAVVDKSFGDPTDFKASALAGADYIRHMQSDVWEDNADNGYPDQDLEDGGWDWVTTVFYHSASPSSMNLYGVTALGLYETYLLDPQDSHFRAMKDAADKIVSIGPDPGVRSASDVTFLLKFAELPDCPDPAYYEGGAQAIWDRHIGVYGTMEDLAIAIRDGRAASYPNGIIPWDIGAWVEAAMQMHATFSTGNHDIEAAAIAEVLYQDSFEGEPGYFEPFGHSQGYDPEWNTVDYWWYTIGITGLIEAFTTAGVYPDEVDDLQDVLLACQYPDGSFSDQYGAQGGDADWQTSAYAVSTLAQHLAPGAALNSAIQAGAEWLAATQDVSGGWVYTSGNHYPEVGGECTTAMALAADATYATLGSVVDGPDPVLCGVTKTVTVSYTPGDATPGLRGYEVTFSVAGPVDFDIDNIVDAGGLSTFGDHQFYAVDNLNGTYTISDAVLGTTAGLLAAANLFIVALTTDGDGPVSFDILSYKLRDPDNAPLNAFFSGVGFTVDCTPPAAVTGITASPGHNKVDVSWTHDLEDVDHFEVYRGLWYDTTVGVSAYPEYDDVGAIVPTRPIGYGDFPGPLGEWVSVDGGLVTTASFTDTWTPPLRGVYYYEVFAVDAAGNGSAVAVANDHATNYWLGDVPSYIDGYVAANDISVLGACYAISQGEDFYNEFCDVGPTDDWSRVGIPLTDSVINFEDLMVFAMNFGVVEPPAKQAMPISRVIDLAWVHKDDGRWALHLVGGTGLKGVRVRADVPVTSVTEGDLLAAQPEMTFLVNMGNAMDVNLALMGRDLGFVGTGELFVLEAGSAVSPKDLSVDVRGTDNSKLDYTLDKISGTDIPKIFTLGANCPNPFNPTTKISFSLPEAQDVVLAVYSLDGRKVATLLNETRGAGDYEVVWMGRNDAGQLVASGTYFYRIDAGPYSQVHKMTLMK